MRPPCNLRAGPLLTWKVAFVGEKDFIDSSKLVPEDWTPPGTLHASVEGADGTYEIWKGSLANEAIKQLLGRIQIFVPLFIEGGSYIGRGKDSDAESDHARWTIWFLYKKNVVPDGSKRSPYTFVGYSTVYRFFYFQAPTPPTSPNKDWELPTETVDLSTLPCRSRLSQFLILEPFQRKGLGALLYKNMYQHYLKEPQTMEFTVEDPNEAFDDLRDVSDLAFLRTLPEFNAIKINTAVQIPKQGPVPRNIVDAAALESLRARVKIVRRQFARVVEMQLMSRLPSPVRPGIAAPSMMAPPPTPAQRREHRLWRLFVKQRLYRHNKDALGELEVGDRIQKLDETVSSVEFEFARLLDMHDRVAKHTGSASTAEEATNGKRKADAVEEQGQGGYKKPRVEDA